ncbi:unnamed protein product [Rotaria socialis]
MSVSDEEFQRFQNQLVELKTIKYQLEDHNKRLTTENVQLKTQLESFEKDSINLRLPAKLSWKIRRTAGRDIDEVLRENDALTHKLHAQEEEFKLQNETMMRELNEYTKKVKQLENELKSYKEGRHTNQNHSNDTTDSMNSIHKENLRLKAENNVLQQKFAELSAKIGESISTASSSNESFQKEDVDVECDDNRSEGGLVHVVSTKPTNGETKVFDANSIRLETEQEEKRLLQEQLRQLEISSNETNTKFLKQIEDLKEKLDEKQNACLSLQHDFEKRIQDMITDNSSSKTANELQIDVLKSDIKRLQDEVQTVTKTKEEEIINYKKRLNESQIAIDQLESQQSKEAYETLMQTVQVLEQQVTSKTHDCESHQRLAEQRKTIIDEMATNSLQADEKAKVTLQSQKEKYQTDIDRLEKENNELKIKDRTLKQYQSRCVELENRIKSDGEAKKTLTIHLEELQKKIIENRQTYEQQLNEQQIQYEQQLDDERQKHQEDFQNLTEILSTKAHTIEELNAQIDVLKQEASTFIDEKRAHERKGATLIKDLQKQLQAEKKKNERMQEKLTELLSGDKAALDDLFYIPKTDGSRQGDTASVSSFSGIGYMDRPSVASTQMSSTALEQENKELIQKLARVQDERSILEEKVRHLESSNSGMANDLIQHYSNDKRGAVSGVNTRFLTPPSRRRQNASTDRQSNTSLNFRNMFESLSGNKTQSPNDDTIKNLQRLLEETLTKNMHLQKDLEVMSLQLQNNK